jgi:molybdopterin-guanine dinucleotide biosynthesis protein A
MYHRDLTVVIQAGGRSSRMGQDKGLVRLGGRPMLEYVLEQVEDLADDLLLVTNTPTEYLQYGLRTVGDDEPGAGALPGLRTALRHATDQYVLVVACDMPFLNRDLLRYEIDAAFATGKDVIVPRWDNQFQTMHAIYKRATCLTAVEHALADHQKRMVSFFPSIVLHKIEPAEVAQFDPHGRSFFNVNTPEQLAEAETLLAE